MKRFLIMRIRGFLLGVCETITGIVRLSTFGLININIDIRFIFWFDKIMIKKGYL
jgi:hypothetical protein